MPPIQTKSVQFDYHGSVIMKYRPCGCLFGDKLKKGSLLKGRDGAVRLVADAVIAAVLFDSNPLNPKTWEVFYRYVEKSA